ncbi:hypothetical protein CHUAL_011254 [Chamberlinius hualienensis]
MLRYAAIYSATHGSFTEPLNILKKFSIGRTVVETIEKFGCTKFGFATLACCSGIAICALYYQSMNVDISIGKRLRRRLARDIPKEGAHTRYYAITCGYFGLGFLITKAVSSNIRNTIFYDWMKNPFIYCGVVGVMIGSWHWIERSTATEPYSKNVAWLTSCLAIGALREEFETKFAYAISFTAVQAMVLFGGTMSYLYLKKPYDLYSRKIKLLISVGIGISSIFVNFFEYHGNPMYKLSAIVYYLFLIPAFVWQARKVKSRADAYHYNFFKGYDPIYQSQFLLLSSLAHINASAICLDRLTRMMTQINCTVHLQYF